MAVLLTLMALMPNGAYPGEPEPAGTAGRDGSLKAPGPRICVCLKVVSYTSTLPDLKLVARRKLPVVFLISARPLYTAPLAADGTAELSTVKTVEAPPVHAEIVPSSVSNIKSAGWPLTLKVTPLGGATIPVGVAGFELPFGEATVNDPFNSPFWSYTLA